MSPRNITENRSDGELAVLASQGDLDALAVLVFERYRSYLCGVVKRYDKDCDDETIEERLHDFFFFLTQPTSEGKYRLRNLDGSASARTYIARALDNHLRDIHEANSRRPEERLNEAVLPDCSDEQDFMRSATQREAEIRILLMALDECTSMPPRERYILLTYLQAERYSGEGRPLKLSDKLAEQLGMRPSTVYNCYDRALKRLQAKARRRLDDFMSNY